MKTLVKSAVVKLGRTVGLDIRRVRTPIKDMTKFVHHDQPLILDVGANLGQTISLFKQIFPKSTIHSFEPGAETFEKLKRQVSGKYTDVHLHNCAIGSQPGKMTFFENTHPDMSSFLRLSQFGWGKIVKESIVDVTTIDQFCLENKIEKIDCLKSDTQGFELEVFKGAQNCILENKIGLIYFEIIFSDMYKGLPSFGEIYDFLNKNNFLLVSLYDIMYQNDLASWSDAIFIHKSYLNNAISK